ncbi:MAG: putative redox protein [Marivirga sp.]|jgi:putative redox protein
MATAKISYVQGLRTEAIHLESKAAIITAAPKDNNGDGSLFSPTDLAATSLASCMLTVMGIYANNNGMSLGDINCEMTKVMADTPRRIAKIVLNIQWKTTLNEKQINTLKKIGLNCPVAKSLHPDIIQEVNFEIN